MGRGLFDRQGELATLDAAIGRAADGRGGTVVIEGGAGTGKSTLLNAARQAAGRAGLQMLSARGGELEREYPFGVIRQLYESFLGAADERRQDRLLSGSAAPAAWVLGLSANGTGMHAAGFAAMHAIYWLTAQLAEEGPLLLAVDDAHWSDTSSLRALDYLARRATELPVMLLVALRSDEPGAAEDLLDHLRTSADAERLTLGALRPESVALIVRSRIPGASDGVCAACEEVTSGNPLYLQELLRSLGSGGVLSAEEVMEATVPSLGNRVIRRAGRVSEDAPALARAMAVLGDGARLGTAAALASVPEGVAGEIAHRLRRIEVLASEDPFVFVHPLVRRSVYDAIPEAELQAAHRTAAGLLVQSGVQPEAVAAHLRMLAPSRSDWVAKTLLAAAERALDRAATDEAIGWLERALAEEASEPPRVHLLARLGLAKTLQRDPMAMAHLREAYELAEDQALRARLAVTLAEILGHAGQWDDAIAVIEENERELGDAELELRTEAAAARAVITLHDPATIDDFDRRRDRYVELAAGDFWASRALSALLATESAYRGRPEAARAFGARALEGGVLLSERGAGGWTSALLLGAFIEAEDFDGFSAALAEVEAAARASGSVFALVSTHGLRGWAHARRGELVAAEADLTAALNLIEDAALLMGVTTVAFFLTDVLLERDNVTHLADLVEQTELPPDFLRTLSGANLLEARGRLRILHRDRVGGCEDLSAAGRIFSAVRFAPTHSSWRSALALALPPAERERALGLAAEELELAEATGLARPVGIALRTLGLLEPDDGARYLRRSVGLLAGSPARLEHARSLVELGASLRRTNNRSQARDPLMAGLELAHACGAHRLSARAAQELQAAGGRRRRANRQGREALTASELRVVRLAADGATNIEIAQQLFVSLKTVETHLTRAYAKLGLTGSGSRRRLPRALQDPPKAGSNLFTISR